MIIRQEKADKLCDYNDFSDHVDETLLKHCRWGKNLRRTRKAPNLRPLKKAGRANRGENTNKPPRSYPSPWRDLPHT